MSALNPEGETVVRYRYTPWSKTVGRCMTIAPFMHFLLFSGRRTIEVVVSPDVAIDNQLCLAMALSQHELSMYFMMNSACRWVARCHSGEDAHPNPDISEHPNRR